MCCSRLKYIDDVIMYGVTDGYDSDDIFHGDCNDDTDGYDIYINIYIYIFIYFNITSLCTLPSALNHLIVKKRI